MSSKMLHDLDERQGSGEYLGTYNVLPLAGNDESVTKVTSSRGGLLRKLKIKLKTKLKEFRRG